MHPTYKNCSSDLQNCASDLQNVCIRPTKCVHPTYEMFSSDLQKLCIRPTKCVHPTYKKCASKLQKYAHPTYKFLFLNPNHIELDRKGKSNLLMVQLCDLVALPEDLWLKTYRISILRAAYFSSACTIYFIILFISAGLSIFWQYFIFVGKQHSSVVKIQAYCFLIG